MLDSSNKKCIQVIDNFIITIKIGILRKKD